MSGAGDVYFSFASPYSWRAASLLRGESGLQWIPFWSPEGGNIRRQIEGRAAAVVYTPMPFQKVLYALRETRRCAAREGRRMALPRDRNAGWDLPHLAFLAARRAGLGEAFLRRAYQARWEDGRDITRVGQLSTLFEAIGLDSRVLTSLTEDSDVCEEAAEGLCRAYRHGVFGVPYFVHRQESYWGIDRMSEFLSDAQGPCEESDLPPSEPAKTARAGSIPDPPAEVLECVGMYDYDHPGGCG
jgi:2-hydroxychromene-2-carboxylate isomerase